MAPVKQYWGAAAILERLGYSGASAPNIRDIISRECLPVWTRRKPRTLHKTFYTDELVIQRWQLARASEYRTHLLSCRAAGLDMRYKALDRKRKGMGT